MSRPWRAGSPARSRIRQRAELDVGNRLRDQLRLVRGLAGRHREDHDPLTSQEEGGYYGFFMVQGSGCEVHVAASRGRSDGARVSARSIPVKH